MGDADQNIYSWRGANLKNILSFEKDYGKDVKIILLEENYRSTKNILEAANEIIKKINTDQTKIYLPKIQLEKKIGFYEALDEGDEADFAATKNFGDTRQSHGILLLIGSLSPRARGALPLGSSACETPSQSTSVTLSGIAILYRANFQSRALEEAMLRYNIPYQVLGVKFLKEKK